MGGWRQRGCLGTPLLTVLRVRRQVIRGAARDVAPTGRDRTWSRRWWLHCHNGGSYDIHYGITPLSTLDGDKIGSVLVMGRCRITKNVTPAQLQRNA